MDVFETYKSLKTYRQLSLYLNLNTILNTKWIGLPGMNTLSIFRSLHPLDQIVLKEKSDVSSSKIIESYQQE